MGPSLIIVFAVASLSLSDARSFNRKVPNYWRTEVQKSRAANPERQLPELSGLQADSLQTEQRHLADDTLSWSYPEPPVDPVTRPPVNFEMRQPVTSNRIAVRCGESTIQVELYQDLLGLSKLIQPEEITLGGCPPTEVDDLSHVLAFESELHDCGSTLLMTEDDFIYAFMLMYEPKLLDPSGITRSQSFVIGVECHYPRRFGNPA